MNNTLTLNPPFSIRGRSTPKFSLKAFWILSFLFIASLLFFYIFQVNEATKAGFSISSYEKKIAEITRGNKNLETSFYQATSLTRLETLMMDLNYEKVGKVHYIQILDGMMVAK